MSSAKEKAKRIYEEAYVYYEQFRDFIKRLKETEEVIDDLDLLESVVESRIRGVEDQYSETIAKPTLESPYVRLRVLMVLLKDLSEGYCKIPGKVGYFDHTIAFKQAFQ